MESSCTKCGSTKIIPEAFLRDRYDGGPIALCVSMNPEALIFKDTHTKPLKASICGDCGSVELYIDDASQLYETYSWALKAAGPKRQ